MYLEGKIDQWWSRLTTSVVATGAKLSAAFCERDEAVFNSGLTLATRGGVTIASRPSPNRISRRFPRTIH